MSVFHFKGDLIESDGEHARYRFHVDYIERPQVTGVFSVNIVSWRWVIVESADSRCCADGVSRDDHCVAALVHKLKKHVATLPRTIFYVA